MPSTNVKTSEQYGYVDWPTVALLIADYDPSKVSDDYFLYPYIAFADTTADGLGLKSILEEYKPGAMDLTEMVVEKVHTTYASY